MGVPQRCPRCFSVLVDEHGDGSLSCREHGLVLPMQPSTAADADVANQVAAISAVPLWTPWPPPVGWRLAALQVVGEDGGPWRAVASGLQAEDRVWGPGEIVLVAEEPGVGLGSALAGIDALDAGAAAVGQPYTSVVASERATWLWLVDGPDDGVALVGERDACWLWVLIKAPQAHVLAVDLPPLADVRDLGAEAQLIPTGGRSLWLEGTEPGD
jgi:hypothetical protein